MFFAYLNLALALGILRVGGARKLGVFNPLRMFLYGWILTLGLYTFSMVKYQTPLTALTGFVILSAQVAFFWGAHLGGGHEVRRSCFRQSSRGNIRQPHWIPVLVVSLLATAGFAVVVGELLFGYGRVLLQDFSAGIAQIRNEGWYSFYAGNVTVLPSRALLVTGSLVAAVLGPFFYRRQMYRSLLFSVLGGAAIIIDSLLKGGRLGLALLILSLFVAFSIAEGGRALQRLFTLPRLLVGTALTVYVMVIFPIQRNPALVGAVEQHLSWADASIADWVKTVGTMPGLAGFEVFAFASNYFSQSLDRLNFFLNETDIAEWYTLGLYNVPLISQAYGLVSSGVSPWHSIRLRIADLMYTEGWSLNPWATGIRDLAIDFGMAGSIACMFVMGYFFQRIYVKALRSENPILFATAVYCSVSAFVFAFVGPFQVRLISNGFWLLGGVAVLVALAGQCTSRRRGTHQTVRTTVPARQDAGT